MRVKGSTLVSASPDAGPALLALAEAIDGPAHRASWIGSLVALGARLARYAERAEGRQLVAVVSVPTRDFAAALIGCGWAMTRPAPEIRPTIELLRSLERGTPVRIVTSNEVLSDYFYEFDETFARPRVHVGGTYWQADLIRALAVLPELTEPLRGRRPVPGSVCDLAGLRETWDQRLASPSTDLAIVGTLKWLNDDFGAYLAKDGCTVSAPDEIASLLLPKDERVPTWSTRLYASASLAEVLPLPKEIDAVVLDGSGAIKYLAEIEAPIVVCVLDRSVADETAAEIIVQLRNTRGEPVSIRDTLGWTPPIGVEALAFTVAL